MKNYEKKFEYIANRQKWVCVYDIIYNRNTKHFYTTMRNKDNIQSKNKVEQLHHRLHNTKNHRKQYPLFIDSLLNLVGMSAYNHINNPQFAKIRDKEAKRYERFLERHPRIAKFVNMDL